jgi:hypothetical protein
MKGGGGKSERQRAARVWRLNFKGGVEPVVGQREFSSIKVPRVIVSILNINQMEDYHEEIIDDWGSGRSVSGVRQ